MAKLRWLTPKKMRRAINLRFPKPSSSTSLDCWYPPLCFHLYHLDCEARSMNQSLPWLQECEQVVQTNSPQKLGARFIVSLCTSTTF